MKMNLLLLPALMASSLSFADPVIVEQGSKTLSVQIDGVAVATSPIAYEIVEGTAYCKEVISAAGAPQHSIWLGDAIYSYAKTKKMGTRVIGIRSCQDLTVSQAPIEGDPVKVLLYSNDFNYEILSTAFTGLW